MQQKEISGGVPIILSIDNTGIENISDILKKISIEENKTSHIFVNGIYAGFSKKVKDGDRIGIFPKNMGLLYKWYFTRVEDEWRNYFCNS